MYVFNFKDKRREVVFISTSLIKFWHSLEMVISCVLAYLSSYIFDLLDSWLELLPLLEKKFGANKRYRFRSHVFPNDVLLPPPIFPNTLLQHSWGNVPGVNILSHLYREPLPSTAWIDFKIIVNPREVFSLTVHGALKSLKPFAWVTSDMARMCHTR